MFSGISPIAVNCSLVRVSECASTEVSNALTSFNGFNFDSTVNLLQKMNDDDIFSHLENVVMFKISLN